MIRILTVSAALAGTIMLAPVAQAQPDSSTGPDHSNSVASGAALSRGPTVDRAANKFVPTITATPFGFRSDQPGLAIAVANGNMVVPTGVPFGSATPMATGNMVGPATTATPLSGGIRTRRGRTGGTSPFGVLGGRFH